MHFRMQRELLLKPLQLAASVAEKRQALPVLSNVLLNVESRRILIVGSDLEVELVGIAPVDEVLEPGKITVPGKKLLDICRSLPEEALIEIMLDNERLIVKSGRSRFVLATIDASQYPALQDSPGDIEFTISPAQLKGLIDKTHFAMASQDVRYFLNGLLLEADGNKLIAVATDGHRLAYSAVDVPSLVNQAMNIIVPRKGISELLKLLSDIKTDLAVVVDQQHFCVHSSEFVFTSKLIEGRFPNYQKVLKSAGFYKINLERDLFKQAVSRASILSNEKNRGVRLEVVDQQLSVSANNPEQEEAEELIEFNYEGQPFEIAFNAHYLLDVLSVMPMGGVRLSMTDSKSGVVFESEKEALFGQYVIMPLQM